MNDTQTQIERLIELAIVQRSELKQLVSELPQLREHLNAEIERTFEEAEPQIRTELEEFCRARATDEHAKTGAALAAKVEQLSKQLEVTTAAKYSVLMAERLENANLLAKAEARIEDAASMLSSAVKEIVTDELSRFPRAGEIDQLRKEFAEPRGLNPRGRWMPDETYQRLDLVTVNGDSFVSNIDGNRERPSRTAGDWTLSAARGNGGGGGVTSLTDLVSVPSNGQLLIGNGSAFVNSTLTAGTGISISNGAGSITINATDGNITLDDGTAAAPALNFTNEPTTGLFRASANVMGFAVNGVSRATMTTTGVTVAGTITPTGSVHAAAGSVGNPSLAFNADQDTGLFNIGANNLGVAIGGAKVLDVASTGLGITGAATISSTTAGSANVGALVLQGGISAGNTGSAASYFGGTITAVGTGSHVFGTTNTVTMAAGVQTNTFALSNETNGLFIKNINPGGWGGVINFYGAQNDTTQRIASQIATTGVGAWNDAATSTSSMLLKTINAGTLTTALTLSGAGNAAFAGAVTATGSVLVQSGTAHPFINIKATADTYNPYLQFQGNDRSYFVGVRDTGTDGLFSIASGSDLLSPLFSISAVSPFPATFAGPVSITGNIGFYGQAATAKPTGVAVTAAAIHAALVTLNLIAA